MKSGPLLEESFSTVSYKKPLQQLRTGSQISSFMTYLILLDFKSFKIFLNTWLIHFDSNSPYPAEQKYHFHLVVPPQNTLVLF